MSVMSETGGQNATVATGTQVPVDVLAERRKDIDRKHGRIAALLQSVGCEGLLVLEPVHFSWLTAGAQARGVLDPTSRPALFFNEDGRWVLCSNADTQRLFDEELDGLGFQVKEWPWYRGRESLLADLCNGRTLACDRPLGQCKVVVAQLAKLRRQLSEFEASCYRFLGEILSHAVEATCRNLSKGESEREVAGQLAHRLIHRGVLPVTMTVAADGRLDKYRQCGYTAIPVTQSAVIIASAQKFGLCATTSRTMCFGEPPSELKAAHDAACRVSGAYVASSWPNAVVKEIFNVGRRVYALSNAEHEWLRSPQGFVTGHALVEIPLRPDSELTFQPHWAVTWKANVGGGVSCDTFLVTDEGPITLTAAENWPLKRIRIHGADFLRPDILIR